MTIEPRCDFCYGGGKDTKCNRLWLPGSERSTSTVSRGALISPKEKEALADRDHTLVRPEFPYLKVMNPLRFSWGQVN